jgi:hypothetical protein
MLSLAQTDLLCQHCFASSRRSIQQSGSSRLDRIAATTTAAKHFCVVLHGVNTSWSVVGRQSRLTTSVIDWCLAISYQGITPAMTRILEAVCVHQVACKALVLETLGTDIKCTVVGSTYNPLLVVQAKQSAAIVLVLLVGCTTTCCINRLANPR